MEFSTGNKEETSSLQYSQLQGISPWLGEIPSPIYKINADIEPIVELLHDCSGWIDGRTVPPCTFRCSCSQPARYICHSRHLNGSEGHRFITIPASMGSFPTPRLGITECHTGQIED